MNPLLEFQNYVLEIIQDVYIGLCDRCTVMKQVIDNENNIVFNNPEDVRRINEVSNLLRDTDVQIINVFETMNHVESVLNESNNIKLKDFNILADIASAHLQASIEIVRSIKSLSVSFKRKID